MTKASNDIASAKKTTIVKVRKCVDIMGYFFCIISMQPEDAARICLDASSIDQAIDIADRS
jgi:hypothetical protein